MAYSTIEFMTKNQRIHDLDLSIACLLIMDQKEIMQSQLLEEMFDRWIDSISYDGSGCINLHLNAYLTDSEAILNLQDVIDKSLRKLEEYEDLYPMNELNPLLEKAKICLQSDYHTEFIKRALTSLRAILEQLN